MNQNVGLRQVAQELISPSLSLMRSWNKSCNINQFHWHITSSILAIASAGIALDSKLLVNAFHSHKPNSLVRLYGSERVIGYCNVNQSGCGKKRTFSG